MPFQSIKPPLSSAGFCLVVGMTFCHLLPGQLPPSQLYRVNMKRDVSGNIRLSQLTWLSSHNPGGYNNHPHLPADSLLFFSSAAPGMAHPDIWRLHLRSGVLVPVTATAEGEYQSAMLPESYYLMVLRQEPRQSDTLQRIWQIPLDGGHQGSPRSLPGTKVGYFRILSPSEWITFELGESAGLWYRRSKEITSSPITRNPGRCFRLGGQGDLIYLQRAGPGNQAFLYKTRAAWTPESPRIPLTEPLSGQEDFALLRDGTILMAADNKVFQFHPIRLPRWEMIADFSQYPIRNISRLETDPDENYIVFVAR